MFDASPVIEVPPALAGYRNELWHGDCLELLTHLPAASVDLIVTSPPYADNRKSTYGGVHADNYVEWFLPIGSELLRVLKPDGSFILNIKEKAVNGERHTYVLELILALKSKAGYGPRNISGIKETVRRANGPTGSGMPGNDACTSPSNVSSICTRIALWFR